VRGVRESAGNVDYEGERKDVEDDTALVSTRRFMTCMNSLDSMSTCIDMSIISRVVYHSTIFVT
jgi:hypothetical protein